MPSHLALCVGCSRHVRAGERVCPFCGFAVRDLGRSAPPVPPSFTGTSRFAIFLAGAWGAACGGQTEVGGITDGGRSDAADGRGPERDVSVHVDARDARQADVGALSSREAASDAGSTRDAGLTDAADAARDACVGFTEQCEPVDAAYCIGPILDLACPAGEVCCQVPAPPYGGAPIEPDGDPP